MSPRKYRTATYHRGPASGQRINTVADREQLEVMMPAPHFRRIYVSNLTKLSQIAQSLIKQEITVCIQWKI